MVHGISHTFWGRLAKLARCPDSITRHTGQLGPNGGDVVERNVAQKTARERRKLEGLDLGMQELRTYFRLFMVSTFLLMFMFCTRISKNRNRDSGNVFDPWIPRKRWLELAAQLSFSWWPSVASDEQSVWNIWCWNTITQFCALPLGVGDEAARIRIVSGSSCSDFSNCQMQIWLIVNRLYL